MTENLETLDELIVGRTTPQIYAFTTNTVPNFLKVGDTYRSVERRLREWRHFFNDLREEFRHTASVSGDVYFRDHSVHKFLRELGRRPLNREQIEPDVYYSTEFFADASAADVDAAVQDILRDHGENSGRYTFYDAALRLPETHHWRRGAAWEIRPNQELAIEKFVQAEAGGRTNLLMFAVMRFGKTFTSLLCAKRIDAKTVVVVSAKADVKSEWKKTVESAGNFEGFAFLDSDALLDDADAIPGARAASDCVVVFLTLQDLQGEAIKEKHSEVFGSKVDLLIIDETHFGARAEKYGEVLREARQPGESPEGLLRQERVDLVDAEEQLKVFDARVRLHLSGSPYRILMGSEFAEEDIVAFVQFADIVHEQEQWDRENPDGDEWENPYFGVPQMIRFAFNPNESSRKKLDELRRNGVTYALSALLQPRAILRDADDDLHKQFEYEREVLDLLRVIDGSQQDENVLGFLDYDKIKDGQMCRHIVIVLPYRASCDAMQALIEGRSDEFRNLSDYQILNISGVDEPRRYPSPDSVKTAVAEAERADRKTITLTVNRMLTGSTVEQWDTMVYLKDTASPQEYDQATFRIQSQYVRVAPSTTGTEIVKVNLKPQTLLVDFDPVRMFRMQEQRSLISNVNTADAGNAKLRERLSEDLRISPIITIEASQIREVQPAKILEIVSEYNRARSIADEARDVPADLGLFAIDEIRQIIELQAEIGNRAGLTLKAFEGEGEDLEIDEAESPDGHDDRTGAPDSATDTSRTTDDDIKTLTRRLQTYYQRILFFAMLATEPVNSLEDVIDALQHGDNRRMAKNLGLEGDFLATVFAAFDPFKLTRLDYKIQNISQLVQDESLTPIQRGLGALNKFTRMSDAEVRTPQWLCEEIIGRMPGKQLRAAVDRGEKILDVGSKSGEFALAIYDRLVNELQIDPAVARTAIYSIPTSGIAYEFTHRFYEIVGLASENVAKDFTAFDLLSDPAGLESAFGEGSGDVQFGAIVGNPPYHLDDGGHGMSSATIYQKFVEQARSLEPRYLSMVIPSRWFAGGKGLTEFRRTMLQDNRLRSIDDYLTASDVFPEVGLKGGICYFLWDRDNPGPCRVTTHHEGLDDSTATRPLLEPGADVFVRFNEGVSILRKVMAVETGASDSVNLPNERRFESLVSSRKPFGLTTTFKGKTRKRGRDVLVHQNGGTGFLARSKVPSNQDLIDEWKIYVGRAAPGTGNKDTYPHRIISTPFIGEPGSISTETYLCIGPFKSKRAAESALSYLSCRLTRLLILLHKPSADTTKRVYTFVPVQGWNQTWTDEKLYEKYGISEAEIAFIEKVVRPMD